MDGGIFISLDLTVITELLKYIYIGVVAVCQELLHAIAMSTHISLRLFIYAFVILLS